MALEKQITHNQFDNNGFVFLRSDDYQVSNHDIHASSLKTLFAEDLELDTSPGSRFRAYLKLYWNRNSNQVWVASDQRYYQSEAANSMDGGNFRDFKELDKSLLEDSVFAKVLHKNVAFIRQFEPLSHLDTLVLGVHFIRYSVSPGAAVSYSSPVWLHTDDEPLVFVHLIDLSSNAIGGDNVISGLDGKLRNVIKLEHFLDTLLLNRNVMHAVTPLGSVDEQAHRDVILFTVEPASTNEDIREAV